MRRLSSCCSMTWAAQPEMRLTAKMGVKRSMSMPRAAEVGRAGIFGVVDAMAEAGDFFLLGEHLLHVFDWVGAGFFDGVEEAHGGLVGSAVEGAFEGADGTGDGGVDVGEGGGDDAGGEGAGVKFVVGVEDKRDVE